MLECFSACFGRTGKDSKEDGELKFPLHFTEAQVCDYFVDRLPSRLQGDGLHLLRAGPGPLVQGWSHELLDEAGVHSYQDREMLLRVRDEMTAAVAAHRQRRRRAHSIDGSKGCTATVADVDGDLNNGGQSPRNSCSRRRVPSAKALELDTVGHGGVGGVSDTDAGANTAADDSVAAAKLAAAAAAANAAAGLGPDGKPFHLTSDWLNAQVSLYRISEDRAEGMRHMASSGTLDPSHRQRPPSAQRREGGGGAAASDCGAQADGCSPAGGTVARKSRLGPSAEVCPQLADGAAAGAGAGCAGAGDGVGSCGLGSSSSPSLSPSSSSCEAVPAADAFAEVPACVAGAANAGAGRLSALPAPPAPEALRKQPTAQAAPPQALPHLSAASKDVCSLRDAIPALAGHRAADAGGGTVAAGKGAGLVDEDSFSCGDSRADDSGADRLAAMTSLATVSPGAV